MFIISFVPQSPDRLSWYTLESRNSSLDRGGSSNSPTAYTRSASVNSELSDRAILQHRMTPLSSSNTSLVYSHRGSLRRTSKKYLSTLIIMTIQGFKPFFIVGGNVSISVSERQCTLYM